MIPLGRDLNLEYQITIMRNPCFGLDEDIASAKKALESVSTSYTSLSKKFGKGKVTSAEAKQVLDQLKATIASQYERKDIQSPCPDIQDAWNAYNQYVDSIGALKCVVESMNEVVAKANMSSDGLKILMAKARQIDKIVSRWLVSKDMVERRDLINQGQRVIDDVNKTIGNRVGQTAEQQKAISTFRAAERYFNNTCK